MNVSRGSGRLQAKLRSGGLAAWSIKHPIGVCMLALAVVVLGLFAVSGLSIDLLPKLIYPDIRVRIVDPGVPAQVMEDQVTRLLEEQLAITEDATRIQSDTSEGSSSVNLSFDYGKDIDIALRDASTRLDRAKRELPATIEAPVIFKRDPSQIPVAEYVVSSSLRDAVEIRSWVDDVFSKWFINLPGVSAAEVGGGLVREIHIIPDQQRLAGVGLSMQDVINALQRGNRESPTGRLEMSNQELSGRISGRFAAVADIAQLPIRLPDGNTIYLEEIVEVRDYHEIERLRIRANGIPGVKMSIQKQPTANTVAVVDVVSQRLEWLKAQNLLPPDIEVVQVADQSVYIVQSLRNSASAAITGAILAMLVVYIFLGNIRRTLIIGSAIPIAIMTTFVLMALGGLTLNIMTLGGLALGVGMLVDNTIVMLENIFRHQQAHEAPEDAAHHAATEVNSAIVASTSTNLAAVLPFLFISGLVGLLFRELIFTISAAIAASMFIAITLVPALAAKVRGTDVNKLRHWVDSRIEWLRDRYSYLISRMLPHVRLVPIPFIVLLVLTVPVFFSGKQVFLPEMDDGMVTVRTTGDSGVTLEETDRNTKILEDIFQSHPAVESVFTIAGGWVFGRSQRETPNQSTIVVQLVPLSQRDISGQQWIQEMTKVIDDKKFAGMRVELRQQGIRGIQTGSGDDDISLRIRGPELDVLHKIAVDLAAKLQQDEGLRNITHSSEEQRLELSIEIDRERANALGLEIEDISQAMRIALEGAIVTDFIEGGRSYDVRIKLPRTDAANPQDLQSILLFPARDNTPPIYLENVADIKLIESPATIKRDNQMRIVEISASLNEGTTLGEVLSRIDNLLVDFPLPDGYSVYEGGAREALEKGKQVTLVLLGLALFLVFVVMAVQYESLLNPMVIILSVPFAAIGVAIGILVLGLPLSMPVWLGMIMLAGVVVNNAIVLVEYIDIVRERGTSIEEAIIEAARLRLRPIMMTTMSTVMGMLPLAIGIGEGSEMLQPLAIVIVCGLTFSMFVSLLLVPATYRIIRSAG
jgi:hydrophobe/amphiphile efflux-1 (HAE1) family protein